MLNFYDSVQQGKPSNRRGDAAAEFQGLIVFHFDGLFMFCALFYLVTRKQTRGRAATPQTVQCDSVERQQAEKSVSPLILASRSHRVSCGWSMNCRSTGKLLKCWR